MKKKPLQVILQVREPSVIELTVEDRVQLDRLVASSRGGMPRRHGDLLAPGTTQLALAPGAYQLRSLAPAHLRVVQGGVTARAVPGDDPKDPWPPPGARATRPDGSAAPPPPRGDEPAGEAPQLTVA